MKYSHTILYVKDVAKTIEFYEKAFGFVQKFITPEKDYGELLSGETTIAFASIELGHFNLKNGYLESNINQKPFGIELTFETGNIKEDFQKAKQAGAFEEEAIVKKPWGQRIGYLRDINGFLIEIGERIKES